MKVGQIFVSSKFEKQFKKLPLKIRKKAVKTQILFSEDPFHPSLRLHKLKGKFEGAWSISMDMKYRIIFKPKKRGEILFVSIGQHAIYEQNF